MMLPTGLWAHSLAIVSIWPTTWCARIRVAFAAATALVMIATPASAPLISVPMELAAAPQKLSQILGRETRPATHIHAFTGYTAMLLSIVATPASAPLFSVPMELHQNSQVRTTSEHRKAKGLSSHSPYGGIARDDGMHAAASSTSVRRKLAAAMYSPF